MARAAGETAVILAADEDDWPLGWYERLGFVRVATVTKPAQAATSAS